MHEVDPQAINALTRPEDRYDTRDLKIAGLWKHILGFFVFVALMVAFSAWLYSFFIPKLYPDGGHLRARTNPAIIPPKPYPLIQSGHDAMMDITQLKAKEREEITTFGWVDEKNGIARVPIEDAIEKTAKEGLAPKSSAVEGANKP